MHSGSIRDIEYNPVNTSIVYMCTDQFYRSTDGGTTFTQISSGLPTGTQANRMSIAVSVNEPDYVYVLAGDQSDGTFLGLWLFNKLFRLGR